MLRTVPFALCLLVSAAVAQTPPSDPPPLAVPADPAVPSNAPASDVPAEEPSPATPPAPVQDAPAAPKPAAPPADGPAAAEQQRFEQYRHDLINLLALRADADLLVAAAELAYPDTADKSRPVALKSAALIKRAQKFGPDVPLVWWVSTFIDCGADGTKCRGEAAAKLAQVAADNAAAWLPSLHVAKDAGQARAILASMAQAQRCDDFWTSGVLAVYKAVQTLPVPAEVLSHGLNAAAARVNFSTGVGGGFLPNYARLGELCHSSDSADEALVTDCLAVARLLENGGTFRTQAVGFGIEDSLLPAGTARDVLRSRQRASAWQKERFLELSGRFPREEALAQTYLDLLGEHGGELATVTALLRSQHVPTDPPAGWQPSETNPTRAADPRTLPPTH